ncbi:hypothetical protein AAY473_030007 [Plecturocebus cupreus]
MSPLQPIMDHYGVSITDIDQSSLILRDQEKVTYSCVTQIWNKNLNKPRSAKMGSHYVAQAGLKLLGSSVPPTSASQSAEIPGVNHWNSHTLFWECKVVLQSSPSPLHKVMLRLSQRLWVQWGTHPGHRRDNSSQGGLRISWPRFPCSCGSSGGISPKPLRSGELSGLSLVEGTIIISISPAFAVAQTQATPSLSLLGLISKIGP